jgi:hypothetical protein
MRRMARQNLVNPSLYLGIEVNHVRRLTVALVDVDDGKQMNIKSPSRW